MSVRRVLMTTDASGGIWDYSIELARGLSEHGVEVALATFGGHPAADQRRATEAVPGLTVHPSDYPLEWMEDPWADLDCAGEWLLDFAADYRPDAVHLNHYYHGALNWPAPCVVVAHACVYSWFEAVHGVLPGPDWRHYREALANGVAGADLVVSPSAAMLSSVKKFYGEPRASRVIANGRRAADFRPRNKHARILAAARFGDEGRNVRTLADTASKVDWPVRVIDDTPGRDARRALFPEVEWLGPINPKRLARELAAAGIYALPARYEPFGLGILQAALAGCPLVLGDIPSLREVWGRAALYVKPDDETTLAITLNNLTANGMERQSWGVRARRRARRYSASRMTRNYLHAYTKLLDERTRQQERVCV
jgi:glycosyltransferase involved in cell wall biosynthesis